MKSQPGILQKLFSPPAWSLVSFSLLDVFISPDTNFVLATESLHLFICLIKYLVPVCADVLHVKCALSGVSLGNFLELWPCTLLWHVQSISLFGFSVFRLRFISCCFASIFNDSGRWTFACLWRFLVQVVSKLQLTRWHFNLIMFPSCFLSMCFFSS